MPSKQATADYYYALLMTHRPCARQGRKTGQTEGRKRLAGKKRREKSKTRYAVPATVVSEEALLKQKTLSGWDGEGFCAILRFHGWALLIWMRFSLGLSATPWHGGTVHKNTCVL